jgi:hypothetical protein
MSIKKMRLFVNLFTVFVLALSANHVAYAAASASADSLSDNTYYVSTSGNDSNPGTQAQPWRTIGKASSKIAAGDTLYIRGGIYQEAITFTKSGTQSAPIKILAYPDETPIIDGNNYKIPASTWGTILEISGNYVQISGLEVRYSNWMGVILSGAHDSASNLNVHHIRETGLLVSGDYGLVENCRVWQNANRNETNSPYGNGGWATGLSAARHPNHVTLRGNVVYNNWGEGLSTFEANEIVMEDNIVYDNWSANVYISDATNVLFQRNLVYMSPDSVIQKGLRSGIMMGDEVYNPPSGNITIINNLIYGTNRNLYWWQGSRGGGMKSVLIANNTFANATKGAGIEIDKGPHQNVRIENNIVQQDGTLPIADVESTTGLTFSTNLWSKTPPSKVSSATDVVGNPQLAKTGQVGAGLLTAEWFRLLSSSPAQNRAKTISEVSQDYFGKSRSIPADIGAIEYGAGTVVPQTITVTTHAPSTAMNGSKFKVAARASSGLAVTYSASGTCTNVGPIFTMKGNSGICTVKYNQAGNGSYAPAPQITENVTAIPAATPTTITFTSAGAYDGWVLESTETSNKGGSLNATATTFQLGDDASDRQYHTILSFDTKSLPDNAVIQSVMLKIKQMGAPRGLNPFNSFGGLLVDIRTGAFGGASALAITDFQAAASAAEVAAFNTTPVGGWYSATFGTLLGRSKINKAGVTQLRLYFTKDDNDNSKADFIRFASGNAASGKPQLIIAYTVP